MITLKNCKTSLLVISYKIEFTTTTTTKTPLTQICFHSTRPAKEGVNDEDRVGSPTPPLKQEQLGI